MKPTTAHQAQQSYRRIVLAKRRRHPGVDVRRMLIHRVSELPPDEDAGGTKIVAHVDQQNREITAAPQQPGEHYQTAHLAQQRREGVETARQRVR